MINLCSREVSSLLNTGKIYGINGPVIYLKGNIGFQMSEMVYVGKEKLVGEVIALEKDLTTIQVYEETSGLYPGEEVVASGNAVSVTLAPGILNNIFDGIERPLEKISRDRRCLYHPRCQRGFSGRRKKMADPSDREARRRTPRRRYHCRSSGDTNHRPQMYGATGSDRNGPVCGTRMVTIPFTRLW